MGQSAQGQGTKVQSLGNYRLVRKLGEGGMGAVFLADDPMMGRKVALKVLPKQLASNPEFLTRFKHEARAAGRLNHVNIVAAYAVDEDHGHHFYVMEYCEGEPLDELLKRLKVLPVERALDYTAQSALGLAHAHEHQIIHRDIKPANIFITKDGIAKILDLGLAKSNANETDAAHTQAGLALGTPHYISPEQARGERDITGRSDIYSLGASLYHLLTGQTPFNGPTVAVIMTKHLTEELPDPRQLRPEIPENVVAVLRKMMAKPPQERYPSCKELHQDLERVIKGEAPIHARVNSAPTTRKAKVAGAAGTGTRRTGQESHGAGHRRESGHENNQENEKKAGLPLGAYIGMGLAGLGLVALAVVLLSKPKQPPVNPVASNPPAVAAPPEKESSGSRPAQSKLPSTKTTDPKANSELKELEPKKESSSKPVLEAPSDAAAPMVPANPQEPAESGRDLFARRQYNDIFKLHAEGLLSLEEQRTRLRSLIKNYTKTAGAAEAESLLKKLPEAISQTTPADALELKHGKFKFYPAEKISWIEARLKCEELGGHLATIEDKEQEDALLKLLPEGTDTCALGGVLTSGAKAWRWVNGLNLTYTHWQKDSAAPEVKERTSYLTLSKNGWMERDSGDGLKGFMCQWDPLPPAASSKKCAVSNSDLETLNENGLPANWTASDPDQMHPVIRDGQRWMRFMDGGELSQKVNLKPEWTWVKLSACVKAAQITGGSYGNNGGRIWVNFERTLTPEEEKDLKKGKPLKDKYSWAGDREINILDYCNWDTFAVAMPRPEGTSRAILSAGISGSRGMLELDNLSLEPCTPEEAKKINAENALRHLAQPLVNGKFIPGMFQMTATGRPQGWHCYGPSATLSGNSARIVSETTDDKVLMYSAIRVEPEWKEFTVSTRLRLNKFKSNDASHVAQIYISCKNGNYDEVQGGNASVKLNKDLPEFQDVELKVKPTGAQVMFIVAGLYNAQGVLDVDEVRVQVEGAADTVQPSLASKTPVASEASAVPDKAQPSEKPAAAVAVTAGKPPALDQDKLRDAEKTLREQFKAEYAKTAAADKLALAQKFYDSALALLKKKKEPVMQHALLTQARDLAMQAGEVELAVKSLDELNAHFTVTDALVEKFTLLQRGESFARTPEALKTLADLCLKACTECYVQDLYDLEVRFAGLAETQALKLKDSTLALAAQARTREARDLQSMFTRIKQSLAALEKNPADGDAASVVGKFYAFNKNEWSRGLALLEKGSDPKAKSAAEKELAGTTDADSQVAAGDAWWEVASREPTGTKTLVMSHAMEFYFKAYGHLNETVKLKVDEKIKVYTGLMGVQGSGVFQPGNLALAKNGTTTTTNNMKYTSEANDGVITGYTNTGSFTYGAVPSEMVFTFPRVYLMREFRLLLWDLADRYYQYTIEVSSDGKQYSMLFDRSKGKWRSWQVLDFQPRPIKSVRLKGLFNSANTNFSFVEFEAYSILPPTTVNPRMPSEP